MPPAQSGRQTVSRLLRLMLLLQSNRFFNAQDLADHLKVSRRTIFRYFEQLEDVGIEIDYHPDRQGYGIGGRRSSSFPALIEGEVASLVLMAQLWGGRDGLSLIRSAREGLVKIIGSLPPDSRGRIGSLIEPIEGQVQERPLARKPVYDGLLQSLVQRVQILLQYQEPSNAKLYSTRVSPYRVVLAQTMWCLIGQSTYHSRVSLFRVPYIRELVPTTDLYSIPPRFDMSRHLAGIWVRDVEAVPQDVWLRFSPLVAPEVLDVIWHPSQLVQLQPDGRVDLRFQSQAADDLVRWVLSFGDQVEILSPLALRQRVREVAQRVWRRHAPISISSGVNLSGAEEESRPVFPT